MSELVKVTLHGELGERFHKEWDLAVKTVGSALNAINEFMDGKLFKHLHSKEQKGAYYRVLINGEDFVSEKPLHSEDVYEDIKNSNLVAKIEDLRTVDIVPLLEGAKEIAIAILGVLLIVVGVLITIGTLGGGAILGVGLIMVGIGLLAAGVTALISKPPAFDDFREVEGGRSSYLFNGPVNIQKEGGPIPVGYGRLLVGSQVISASYLVSDISSEKEVRNTPFIPTPKSIAPIAARKPWIDP